MKKMTSEEIIQKINGVLAEEFEVDPSVIQTEASIVEALGLDSLDMIDVVVLIDKNFGITLVEEDFKGIKTFQDFYNLIIRKYNELPQVKE